MDFKCDNEQLTLSGSKCTYEKGDRTRNTRVCQEGHWDANFWFKWVNCWTLDTLSKVVPNFCISSKFPEYAERKIFTNSMKFIIETELT